MSLKKTAAIAAAVGALAAISVPAMALENEFHGSYKLKYFLSDYESGGSGAIIPNAAITATSVNATQNLKANNYFEQRARIFYTAKANDDLKLVTGFEIDSVFGDYAQGGITQVAGNAGTVNTGTATRNSGGAMEADAVNLETKWVYLDFKIPATPVKVTAGIQPYYDKLKGTFLDADIAGVNFKTTTDLYSSNLGYFRAYDNSYLTLSTAPHVKGEYNLQFVTLDGTFNISKDLKVGAAYILDIDDRTTDMTNLNVFGLNAEAKVGPLSLSGFVATQQGLYHGGANSVHYNGWAFNAAGKLAAGPGTLRSALLMTTGSNDGKNGWQSIEQRITTTAQNSPSLVSANKNGTNSYNESNMMLLNRATGMQGTSTDNNLVYSTNNLNQGVWLYSAGYDATITPKLYANANVGLAWVAKTNAKKPVDQASHLANGSNFMGTEVNIETGYKMYDNLTASVQAAYVILGGYYTRSLSVVGQPKTPEDPYTARVVLSYAF
jgi:hypothetical protein